MLLFKVTKINITNIGIDFLSFFCSSAPVILTYYSWHPIQMPVMFFLLPISVGWGLNVCVAECVRLWVHECACVCARAHVHVCACVCVHVCVCTCVWGPRKRLNGKEKGELDLICVWLLSLNFSQYKGVEPEVLEYSFQSSNLMDMWKLVLCNCRISPLFPQGWLVCCSLADIA